MDRCRCAGILLQFGVHLCDCMVQIASSAYEGIDMCGQPLPYVGGLVNAADRCWRRSGRDRVEIHSIRAGHTVNKKRTKILQGRGERMANKNITDGM